MIQNKNQNIIYLGANNLYGYEMSKFHPTNRFEWTDSKDFDLNKDSSNILNGCVLEVIMNIKMFYWIKSVWDIWRTESQVKITEWGLIKSRFFFVMLW